jgi:hypothetical protein
LWIIDQYKEEEKMPTNFNGITPIHAESILEREFGNKSYTPPTSWFLGLTIGHFNSPTGATEMYGSGYARAQVSNNPSNWQVDWDNEDRVFATNLEPIVFPVASSNYVGEIFAVGFWETATGGNPLYVGSLERSKIVQQDDILIFAPESLRIYLYASQHFPNQAV